MIYYENVDAYGHKYGPESNQTKEAVRDIDMIIYNAINELKRRHMDELGSCRPNFEAHSHISSTAVNLYIVSDHGMTTRVKTINLTELVDFTDVKYMLDKVRARSAFDSLTIT